MQNEANRIELRIEKNVKKYKDKSKGATPAGRVSKSLTNFVEPRVQKFIRKKTNLSPKSRMSQSCTNDK